MSIVMPAGKSTLNWSPIIKQASAGGKPVAEKDELYEAAKKVVKAQFDAKCLEDGKMGAPGASADMPCENGGIDGAGGAGGAGGLGDSTEIVEEIPGVVTDEVAKTEPGAEGATGAEGAVAKAQEAIEQAKAAVEEVALEIGVDTGAATEGVEESVEIDIPDEDDVVEVELEGEKCEGEKEEKKEFNFETKDKKKDKGEGDKGDKGEKGEKEDDGDKDGEIVKESTEDKEACASNANSFVKISALSPKTRKKLYNFWANELGYDKDYCKLLVTDYEK